MIKNMIENMDDFLEELWTGLREILLALASLSGTSLRAFLYVLFLPFYLIYKAIVAIMGLRNKKEMRL